MLSCSICITSHNRRAQLEQTLARLNKLHPAADEIIVTADGCSDDTVAVVRTRYPAVRLLIHEQACGSVASRNAMAYATDCDLFLSLDDDSYPIEDDFIGRIRELFDNPRLAVAAFPQRSDEYKESLITNDFGQPQLTGTFANSGAVIRRDVFLELGGYPDFFRHAYEEPDFALRCIAAGWQVWRHTRVTIRHHYSSIERNEVRTHHQHARNELLSVLLRCPLPYAIGIAVYRALSQFGYACKRGINWVVREPIWWWWALKGLPWVIRKRRPVPWQAYRKWLSLS